MDFRKIKINLFLKEINLKTKEVKNLKQLKNICFDLVKDFKVPLIVLLEGPLAVGKSQAVRYMAEALGYSEKQVCSPTFSLINIYEKQNKERIYHVDLYRLENESDIDTTAFWDIFYAPTTVFIEWPQLVKNKLPGLWNKLFIKLDFNDKESRTFRWNWEIY